MQLDQYQPQIVKLASNYPHFSTEKALPMYTLGLAEEAGEVAGIIKRHLRGDYNLHEVGSVEELNCLKEELGDVLAYLALVANEFGIRLSEIAEMNLEKLESRVQRHKQLGKGGIR